MGKVRDSRGLLGRNRPHEVGYRADLRGSQARTFVEQLRDEGMSVAAAAGHPMPAGFADRVHERSAGLPPETKSSMANDLDRGKPIEVASLSGRMHELGAEVRRPHARAYSRIPRFAFACARIRNVALVV